LAFSVLHSFEPHPIIRPPPFALNLPEGGAGQLEAGGGARLNAIAGGGVLELLHANIATIKEEATMEATADKQSQAPRLAMANSA
jgi:hypothetical protein